VLQKLERAYLILTGSSERGKEEMEEVPADKKKESRDERYEFYLESIRSLADKNS
jgi:hypothetical protein